MVVSPGGWDKATRAYNFALIDVLNDYRRQPGVLIERFLSVLAITFLFGCPLTFWFMYRLERIANLHVGSNGLDYLLFQTAVVQVGVRGLLFIGLRNLCTSSASTA